MQFAATWIEQEDIMLSYKVIKKGIDTELSCPYIGPKFI